MLKRVCTYAIQLWVTAFTSNIVTLENFQSKHLRIIADVP
jgi:hypothetical protein